MGLEPEQVGIRLGRPARTCQLEVRDDVAAGPDQRFEQAELGRRQRQAEFADAGLVAAGLDRQRARRQRPAAGVARARRRSTRRMTALILASSSALPKAS